MSLPLSNPATLKASVPGVPVIEFQRVTKAYPLFDSPGQRLVELLTLNKIKRHRDFIALHELNFAIHRGETFCLIGENGSGKSTLLQLVAGILEPSSGTVRVNGRVSALLELGSGFNPEFTGKENVYLNAAILGLTREQIDVKYHDIIDFAEIGEFLHQPVKTYSSGMAMRLAFSVAIHVDPDILLVDEALAVGDIYFRQRCLRKVHELRSRGVTILFVSHSIGDVKAIGDRVLWLDHGQVRALGATDEIAPLYLAEMARKDSAWLEESSHHQPDSIGQSSQAPEVVKGIPNIDHRHGEGGAEIVGITLCNEHGETVHMLQPNSSVILRISARAKEYLALPNVGYLLRNHLGVDFAGSNTTREGTLLSPMQPGDTVTVDFHLQLPELYPSAFSFSPAVADGALHNYRMHDWIDNALTVQMGHGEGQVYGYMHLECRVEVNARLGELTRG
jgi:lipopolysaccharide transport system ATP-binding protein